MALGEVVSSIQPTLQHLAVPVLQKTPSEQLPRGVRHSRGVLFLTLHGSAKSPNSGDLYQRHYKGRHARPAPPAEL